MPVTVRPSPTKAGRVIENTVPPSHFLRLLDDCKGREPKDPHIYRSSFDHYTKENLPSIIPYLNGFVHGTIRAFKHDLHLVLRPDDVWLSIATQFSFYMNGRNKELRARMLRHSEEDGILIGEIHKQLQGGALAQLFTDEIRQRLAESSLLDWMVPDFTTSTPVDKSLFQVVMTVTKNRYFTTFECSYQCGFPSVTLLRERKDWALMRTLVDNLLRYGEEPTAWHKLLVPVLNHFVMTFDHPDQKSVKQFWVDICREEAGEEVESRNTYAGWITAFAYWDSEGSRIVERSCDTDGKTPFKLGRTEYPLIVPDHIPAGVVEFPLMVKDKPERVPRRMTLVAGSVGVAVMEVEENLLRGVQKVQVVHPSPGWWLLVDKEEPLPEESKV